MPREKLNRNAYLVITSGRKHGTCTRTSSPRRVPWTGERAAAGTQNYAAQEVPGFSRAADDRCCSDALVARVILRRTADHGASRHLVVGRDGEIRLADWGRVGKHPRQVADGFLVFAARQGDEAARQLQQ